MKFLLVSPFTSASGSAIRFWNIAIELKRAGHEVIFVDRKAVNGKTLFTSDEIRYYNCFSTGKLLLDIIISLFFNTYILFRNINCDVFYALKPAPNNCIPALIAKLLGKRIVIDIDDLDYAYLESRLNRKLFRIFFDTLPKQFPLVTYHTPNLKEYLSDRMKISKDRLYYLAQGVSNEFLKINPGDYKPHPKSLIYVATLGITSDFGDLIPIINQLCKDHPELSMSVVGEGCRKQEFEKEISRLGIEKQVYFKGRIDHRELPSFVASHRIGVNYMRVSEVNQCRAILKIREYLACGLEVVCNDVGDVELFKEHIYIENNLESMRKKIDNLFVTQSGPNLTGRQFIIDNYRWSSIVSDFLKAGELCV